MAQVVLTGEIFQKIGCTDPLASNYDPIATTPCNGCCQYGKIIVGCRDPLAINYNSNANSDCNNCCVYQQKNLSVGFNGNDIFDSFTPNPIDFSNKDGSCEGPYSIATDGEVLGVTSAECCNEFVIGPITEGHEYYWDGETCYHRKIIKCPADIVCVNCNSFDWWNDTYIANHNGQGLQTSNPTLWQYLVDIVANSGQTFYVQTSTGNLLEDRCCPGVFRDGVCFCEEQIEEEYEPKCISTLQQFLDFYSSPNGYNYLILNATSIGGALSLTNTQFNFVLANLFNSNDTNGNGTLELTEARLLVSNALNTTGGFYVNFGLITGNPKAVNKGTCDSIGGYWNNLAGQCMCQPIVDQCEIDITEVQVINSTDFYNNQIQIVTYKNKDEQISEACCNRLIKDYNLPWVWQSPWCYAVPKENCLPIQFSLNDEKMVIPACSNNLELSMWVYFGKPENPCQPIPDPPDNDIIIIDGEACDIILTPNTGSLSTTGNTGGGVSTNELWLDILDLNSSIRISQIQETKTNENNTLPVITGNTICCYSNLNPILARITTTDPLLNLSLIQIKEYNSNNDYFEKWVQIKATLPTSGLTLNFGVYLEIYQGLNCCCNYDIFIDDIRVDCPKDESVITYNNIQCPGFEITRVIDNKKSWVYNPGTPQVGISDYDKIEREDGSFGMLNGEGNINRTFAPSLDANIPWRYTDYWEQSSVLEKHSNLVLNSKELSLTFDMCADCPISGTTLVCPSGYTLTVSGTTNVCVKTSEIISASTVPTVTYLSLYDLENYKKTFQSFWIPFMEQFIPATTIWVAGERWCNEPCTIINPCDYDFELTEAEISIEPIKQGVFPLPKSGGITTTIPVTISSTLGVTNPEPIGSLPTKSQNFVPIKDLGFTIETYIIPTEDQLSVDLTSSRYTFNDITTVTELIS